MLFRKVISVAGQTLPVKGIGCVVAFLGGIQSMLRITW